MCTDKYILDLLDRTDVLRFTSENANNTWFVQSGDQCFSVFCLSANTVRISENNRLLKKKKHIVSKQHSASLVFKNNRIQIN